MYQIQILNKEGKVVDESEWYESQSYMFMTLHDMFIQVKPGWKLVIQRKEG